MPHWLTVASWVGVGLGIACALLVTADLLFQSVQPMWIMNVVWPLTALWSGPVGAWAYFRYGRSEARTPIAHPEDARREPRRLRQPFPVLVAKATTHCGSGCTLGDIIGEFVFAAVPFTLFGHRLFGAWFDDFTAAFLLGVAFQYFTIKPMRGEESALEGIKDAVKADALSLGAWQIGMYGWMACVTFVIFGHELRPSSIVFWFMMQGGMLAGFATSFPINWLLLKRGVKEPM